MPKVQKLRKYKLVNQLNPYEIPLKEENIIIPSLNNEIEGNKQTKTTINNVNTSSNNLSRGQRKRQEKRERVLTKLGVLPLKNMKNISDVNSISSSVGLNSNKQKKPKSINSLLSELEATLPTENNEIVRPAALPAKTNKIKKSIAVRETQRMKLVEEHPSFKADPLLAMKTHIEHMIALKTQQKNKK